MILAWDVTASLLYIIVLGSLGNYWYWNKFKKVAVSAKTNYADHDNQLRFLRDKGGTKSTGVWVLAVVLLIPFAWALYWAGKGIFDGYVFDATGPLTVAEVEANFIGRTDVLNEAEKCAHT